MPKKTEQQQLNGKIVNKYNPKIYNTNKLETSRFKQKSSSTNIPVIINCQPNSID